MSTEDIVALSARIRELESRLKYIYEHFKIEYVETPDPLHTKVIELVKKGNKIEAIKEYRQIHNVGLAEAKHAVDEMEARYL
jgi:ribosomal protein L7/L12